MPVAAPQGFSQPKALCKHLLCSNKSEGCSLKHRPELGFPGPGCNEAPEVMLSPRTLTHLFPGISVLSPAFTPWRVLSHTGRFLSSPGYLAPLETGQSNGGLFCTLCVVPEDSQGWLEVDTAASALVPQCEMVPCPWTMPGCRCSSCSQAGREPRVSAKTSAPSNTSVCAC